MPRSTRLPSPAMLVALVALVIALGGTSYAAITLPKNSVGTKQIRKHAVTASKIKARAVTKSKIRANAVRSSKVKDGSLLAKDFKAGQLPAGPKGDKGDPGATNVVYHREQAELSLGGIAQAVATCAPDEKLVGGSAALLRAGDTISADPNVSIVASYPATAGITAATDGAAASRWVAIAHASEASSTRIVAFAACAKP
jgi:hypothetical protein